MMEFHKYSSIENSFNYEYIRKVKDSIPKSLKFVVQEKVHGSNASFITNGWDVKFAKRTGIVADNEKFFNYEELFDRYKPRILDAYKLVKKKCPDMDTIIVYGEFFGGYYPHKDVKADHRFMTIQKGVCYCPHHEFYGYDIYVIGSQGKRYMNVEDVNEIFERLGFIYAKTLFEGSLDECLEYPNKFDSTIYKHFGYPQIEDNICEGVVIRPVVPTYIGYGERVLIKNKNERFAEKKSEKKRPKIQKLDPVLSDSLTTLMYQASLYITENRLSNVASHIGEVQMPQDLGKLLGLFSKDILTDFVKDNSADYYALEKNEQKLLNKELNAQASMLLKSVYGIK